MKLAATAFVAAALLCSQVAVAQTMAPRTAPHPGQWSVTPEIGADFNAGGTFNKSASASTSLIFNGFTGSATASINSKKFSDYYDTPLMGGVSVGYGVSNQGEVFGRFSYEHAAGNSITAGTVSAAGTFNGTAVAVSAPISIKPDDLNQYNFEVGYRHFIETGTALTPYVAGSVGAARVSAIKADVIVGGVDVGKTAFYDGSTIAVVGLSAGVTYAVAPGASVGVEAGLHYNSSLNGDSSASGVTASGDRLTVPLLATGRLTF